MIYHITTPSRWQASESDSYFAPESYVNEKFIHCCEAQQMEGVLSRYFKGMDNLLVLHIDEQKLEAKLEYEIGTNDELFPHLYGMINKDAIVSVERIR